MFEEIEQGLLNRICFCIESIHEGTSAEDICNYSGAICNFIEAMTNLREYFDEKEEDE